MQKRYILRDKQVNANYENASATLPLCSCLIRRNSEKKGYVREIVTVHFEPPSTSVIDCYNVDEQGIQHYEKTFRTDNFKKTNRNKRKLIESFFYCYRSLYRQREVSLFDFTFTQANQAKKPFSDVLDNVKYRFESLNVQIRGYIWTLEVSEDLHWHYHLCLATDRTIFSNVDNLKLNKAWGQRTQIDTVKNPLAKQYYMIKKQPKIDGFRSYGSSKDFK